MDGKEEDIRMDLEEKSGKGKENPGAVKPGIHKLTVKSTKVKRENERNPTSQLCPPLSTNLWPD